LQQRCRVSPVIHQMAQTDEWAEEWGGETMDLESFITEHGLDQEAATMLRAQSEDVVWNVISQGPPTGANPSAIVTSRIKEASDGPADMESFLAVVDDMARQSFMSLDDVAMQTVMEEGYLTGENPSAILMSRVKKVKQALGLAGKKRKASTGGGALAAQLPKILPIASKASQGVVSQAPGMALQALGSSLCELNAAVWSFDVSPTTLMDMFKRVLETRQAATAATGDGERPKKRRATTIADPPVEQWPGQRADGAEGDAATQKQAVLDEVVRVLTEAGGTMPLHKIGSKSLSELRKGVVGNLAKFLQSHTEVVTFTSDEAGPMVSLVW
jgi:hypothetical protein